MGPVPSSRAGQLGWHRHSRHPGRLRGHRAHLRDAHRRRRAPGRGDQARVPAGQAHHETRWILRLGQRHPHEYLVGSFDYIQNDLGLVRSEIHDVTDNALQARDDDYSRALDFFRHAKDTYYGLKWFPACSWSLNRLIMNFYRQPGTALYKRMMKNSNATKENPGDREWCKELAVPTSFCDDRRVDTYAHVAYRKPE